MRIEVSKKEEQLSPRVRLAQLLTDLTVRGQIIGATFDGGPYLSSETRTSLEEEIAKLRTKSAQGSRPLGRIANIVRRKNNAGTVPSLIEMGEKELQKSTVAILFSDEPVDPDSIAVSYLKYFSERRFDAERTFDAVVGANIGIQSGQTTVDYSKQGTQLLWTIPYAHDILPEVVTPDAFLQLMRDRIQKLLSCRDSVVEFSTRGSMYDIRGVGDIGMLLTITKNTRDFSPDLDMVPTIPPLREHGEIISFVEQFMTPAALMQSKGL